MKFIKRYGIKEFLDEQEKRQKLLEQMLEQFNEGRSRTLYCVAATLLPIKALKKSLNLVKKKVEEKGVENADIRNKAKILKEILNAIAQRNVST